MNERIRKLANVWANRRAEDEKLGIVYTFSEPALEQFAKLIVEECASVVDTYGRWILYDKLAVKIKQHFGVTYD
jgi:hypothetical protein